MNQMTTSPSQERAVLPKKQEEAFATFHEALASSNPRATLSTSIMSSMNEDIGITSVNLGDHQQMHNQHEPNRTSFGHHSETSVDFVGPSDAVKELFSLPYSSGSGVNVALHNIGGGTLLLDGDPSAGESNKYSSSFLKRSRVRRRSSRGANQSKAEMPRPSFAPTVDDEEGAISIVSSIFRGESLSNGDGYAGGRAVSEEQQLQLPPSTTIVSVSPPNQPSTPFGSQTTHNADLSSKAPFTADSAGNILATRANVENTKTEADVMAPIQLDPPEHYTREILPPPKEPREYLSWKFHDMNMLIASDAVVYRPGNIPPVHQNSSNPSANKTADPQPQSSAADQLMSASQQSKSSGSMSQALTVRVVDAMDMRSQFKHHQDRIQKARTGNHEKISSLDRQQYPSQNLANLSNTSFANKSRNSVAGGDDTLFHGSADSFFSESSDGNVTSSPTEQQLADSVYPLSSPDLRGVELQTCIVPSPMTAVGAPLSEYGLAPSPPSKFSEEDGSGFRKGAASPEDSPQQSKFSSPVCTVLDAYLDNIMANVPQLALCLREKGFIRSVKLLRTEDIPTAMMTSSTLGMEHEPSSPPPSSSQTSANDNRGLNEPLFSPHVVDVNATMLLRFLKANCSRENATYLLRRNEGEANIQLYDISSISTLRQRKWTWWLAMMSYRFALRLGQITQTVSPDDSALRRTYRARRRNLLRNALELLEELADMDGGNHETVCAAINEHLADTFLWKDEEQESTTGPARDGVDRSFGFSDTHSQPSPTATAEATMSLLQSYGNITADGLSNAQDYLISGTRKLWPLLERARQKERATERRRRKDSVVRSGSSSSGSDFEETLRGNSASSRPHSQSDDGSSATPMDVEAVSMQLYGLNHKLINVSLRLAEHHLKNYWSSSAMHSLRTAARTIAEAVNLLRPLGLLVSIDETGQSHPSMFARSLRRQFAWLWEYCGHFARSFAADYLWRERGHACGDDVVSLLQDAEAASCHLGREMPCSPDPQASLWVPYDHETLLAVAPISSNTAGQVTLQSITPLVILHEKSNADVHDEKRNKPKRPHVNSGNESSHLDDPWLSQPSSRDCGDDNYDNVRPSAEIAQSLLTRKRQIQRDEWRVLVASTICYSRALGTFSSLVASANGTIEDKRSHQTDAAFSSHVANNGSTARTNGPVASEMYDESILVLLRQRLGDACNEIGKILLTEVKTLLSSSSSLSPNIAQNGANELTAAGPLLVSAQYWFQEGLRHFEDCADVCNIALLRCNLCQCCKVRSNSNVGLPKKNFSNSDNSEWAHAESCLEDAANHLLRAHEGLGERDVEPKTWDMVSEELAATYLVLGVRRRQALLGGGATPVIVQALRLSPGKERSIIDPIERSIEIYEKLGNNHQMAAANYQLALFFSKIWTCQRDESKARQKLSLAFKHFDAAHRFFFTSMRGNEPTFVVLSLDLSNLYSGLSVSGESDCLSKALTCCLDTCDAFSADSIALAKKRFQMKQPKKQLDDEWMEKMTTLASTVEERILKLLLKLVKLEKGDISQQKFKQMYRLALQAKMKADSVAKAREDNHTEDSFSALHIMLKQLKEEYKAE